MPPFMLFVNVAGARRAVLRRGYTSARGGAGRIGIYDSRDWRAGLAGVRSGLAQWTDACWQSMTERVLAVAWLPLDRAAVCLNDETVFDVGEGTCPRCGGETFALLARWLQERT